jgi:hypothetical protein
MAEFRFGRCESSRAAPKFQNSKSKLINTVKVESNDVRGINGRPGLWFQGFRFQLFKDLERAIRIT